MQRREFIAGLGSAAILPLVARAQSATPASAAETPLVPILSILHHWDHHWYVWLPGDPRFEAMEVMVADRGQGVVPLVWVFFTEREPPKRQVHYYNDPGVADALQAHARDIALTMSGPEDGPRDVSVRLADSDGRPIEIDVGFDPGARLVTAGAGLTDQVGHSGDRLLLLFFRERNALARTARVAITGRDVALPQPEHPVPFQAAYSSNIFVSGFPFGDQRFGFDGGGADRSVVRFARAAASDAFVGALSGASQLELAVTADGALLSYRHRNAGHLLDLSFDPPLPAANRLDAAVESSYRISLDAFRDLVAGTVGASRRGDTINLDWRFQRPEWTRSHPLRTSLSIRDGAATRVELRPLQVRP
jgi:hypothetical protein